MFSLNEWQKILVIKRIRTCYFLCKGPGCNHSTSKKHVRDRIFKFISIQATVIYQIPEFTEITELNESSAPFRKIFHGSGFDHKQVEKNNESKVSS